MESEPGNRAIAWCEMRQVSEPDLEALLGHYCACEDFLALGPRPRASLAMVKEDLAASREAGRRYEGVYVLGELAGIVDYVIGGHESVAGHAYLALLMLSPKWRGQGLGATVVHRIEALAAAAGAVCIGSSVQVNNQAGLRFWQRLGYAISAGPEQQHDGTNVWHLHRGLGVRADGGV